MLFTDVYWWKACGLQWRNFFNDEVCRNISWNLKQHLKPAVCISVLSNKFSTLKTCWNFIINQVLSSKWPWDSGTPCMLKRWWPVTQNSIFLDNEALMSFLVLWKRLPCFAWTQTQNTLKHANKGKAHFLACIWKTCASSKSSISGGRRRNIARTEQRVWHVHTCGPYFKKINSPIPKELGHYENVNGNSCW